MRVSRKGQVTIPKPMRERAGIGPGTEVDFSIEGGRMVLVKRPSDRVDPEKRAREFEDYLERVGGTLKLGMSTDEFMQLMRGE